MTLGSERDAVQSPFIRYAVEAKWTYLPPAEAIALRGGESAPIFKATLAEQLIKLNPEVVERHQADELIRRLERVPPNIQGNLDVWEHLRGIRKVFIEAQSRERDVRFLDAENPDANTLHVTDEWVFRPRPDAEAIRFDVALVVNGIPLLLVEAKSARRREGLAEALDQVRRYHEQGPEELAVMQLFAITHLHRFKYGATWNTTHKALYDWRAEAQGDYESLVKAFVAPRRVLRVISDFIVFSRVDGQLSKFVLRPHQMRAAEKVVGRGKDPGRRRGLIWHTQGSGKTYTMLCAAKLLLADPALANPTVLVIVDRTELEGQMARNLDALGFHDVRVATSKEDVQGLLASDWRGLVLSMIHKFDRMPAALCTRENVFVLIDEAHRSTAGDLGNFLMGALPNATLVGFTGTPIDRTAHGRGTFKTFGPDDESGFLDRYSIAESIPDGTTLPLHYALAPNELLVDRETLEREFLSLAELEGVSEIETLNKVLERAVTLRNMLKSPARVEAVTRHVAEHFCANVEPMGYKGLLVGVDREACVLYKDALDRHLPADYADVLISHGHNDGRELRRFHYDETREEEVRKAFRAPDGRPKILIVTEKLLTGFDAPVLYCMYLDKPMRDHVLLQAIARVNRPYEDRQERPKPAGLVLDFVGVFEKLERALAFDSKDVSGVVTGIGELRVRFAGLIAVGRERYLGIARGLRGDKEVEALVEHFRDAERRAGLQEFVAELENLYEIISPDAFLRPYLDDYRRLMDMYAVVREALHPGLDVDRSFLRKTAQLVAEHTAATAPRSGRVHRLDEEALAGLRDSDAPDTVKVINLVKFLHDQVAAERDAQPFLLSIGQRAEELAEAFRDGQLSTEDALDELAKLCEEAIEAERAQAVTGLAPDAFAVLWYLRGKGFDNQSAEAVARGAEVAFAECPLWRRRSEQERELRMKLHTAIIDAGRPDGTGALVDDIVASLRRRTT